ncbi:MAG: PAS domain-containing sensor histidine kinase [Flavisolibacter sp.]
MREDYPMLDLFEKTLDLVCIVDKAGRFKKVNPAVIKTLGYTEEELFAHPVSVLIHPDDREMTAKRRTDLLNDKPLLNFQNRYISKKGAIVWLEWTSIYIPENQVVFAIAKDITSRKMMEIGIEESYKKYKDLAAHFKQHVEKDREYFATELHEEIAQMATVVRMHFESVSRYYSGEDQAMIKSIEHGLATSQLLIQKIRKLSYSMNPARIEELGLDVVLLSLCQEFSALTKIQCRYEGLFDEKALDYEIKLDLLRICQEALLNVMHHAEASQVKIRLEAKKNKIELTITDNGKGFSHESKQSFGLRKMQGRVDSINGRLHIKTENSKGTTVHVSVDTTQ